MEIIVIVFGILVICVIAIFIKLGFMDSHIEDLKSENEELKKAIQTQSKDFHGRICAIDERTKKV